jgi:hypothetical protein
VLVYSHQKKLVWYKPDAFFAPVNVSSGNVVLIKPTSDNKMAHAPGKKVLLYDEQPSLELYDFIFSVFIPAGMSIYVCCNALA